MEYIYLGRIVMEGPDAVTGMTYRETDMETDTAYCTLGQRSK